MAEPTFRLHRQPRRDGYAGHPSLCKDALFVFASEKLHPDRPTYPDYSESSYADSFADRLVDLRLGEEATMQSRQTLKQPEEVSCMILKKHECCRTAQV